MEKPSLLIASTPMQIINGIEAINHFKLENVTLALVFRERVNDKNNNQLEEISKLYDWKKIIKINKKLDKRKFKSHLKSTKEIKKEEYKYLFFGVYSNISKLIIANTHKEHLYLVDDGTATITFHKNTSKEKNKTKIRNIKYFLFGLKIKIKDEVNIFTYFNLEKKENLKIVKNNLNFFMEKSSNFTTDNEHIFFLGQPLENEKLISKLDYEKYLEKIISNEDRKILYIPHRFESIDKIKKLQSRKFEIVEINEPIEMYFMNNRIRPKKIISFFTTAIYTLEKMYPDLDLNHIVIPIDKFLKKGHEYHLVYQSLINDTSSKPLYLD